MKSIITLIASLLMTCSFFAQPYQKHFVEGSNHYHDLNVEPLADGSTDYIVAGNLFDPSLTNEQLMLKRLDANGNTLWINTYGSPGFQHLRVFDVVTYEVLAIITGSVDIGGTRHVFVAKVHAGNGNIIDAKYYEIVSSNFNSVGLHLEYTESDADGDTFSDPGFVVGGFFGDCYNVDVNCTNNLGFVLRTDFTLNELWTIEVDTNLSTNSNDYDFVNHITETDDGFFLNGSATVVLSSGMEQQAVLAHKIDFNGLAIWDQSYYFGNSRDVSVDTYYDQAADELYMLSNYSFSHYFSVTVMNDAAGSGGTIDLGRSWYAYDWNDLNRYGFSIMESVNDPGNLVITGYDRDENWTDGNNVPQFGNSNVFVYEFNKSTGNQVGDLYQYTVPHVEPVGDDYNFWFWQMPLMYYPDISFPSEPAQAYYHVGYRTMGSSPTDMELNSTGANKVSNCDYLRVQLNKDPIVPINVPVISGNVPNTDVVMTITSSPLALLEEECESTLSAGENTLDQSYLYPNPAVDRIYVRGMSNLKYSVYNSIGARIDAGELLSDGSLYVGNFRSGMYILELTDESGRKEQLKFVKR